MPRSETDICNDALALITAGRIQSIKGESKVERDCRAAYEPARDEVLADYPWTFARGRKPLQQLAETPAFGWSYTYQLPNDYLAAISLESKSTPYEIEGNTLLCNLESGVNLIYIKKVEDPTLFTTQFIGVLKYRLASPLASIVKKDTVLAQSMLEMYLALLPSAENSDSNSDRPDIEISNPYVEARGS